MYKIDLHTHSTASHDGGLKLEHYKSLLEHKILDFIAITDHNSVHEAVRIKDELGDQIIVGEEVMSASGEIIGLYLDKPIRAGMSARDTIGEIKAQGGLVYIPHPFEIVRKGISLAQLDELVDLIDIIEVTNGRTLLRKHGARAVVWARLNNIAQAASSDAHGRRGIGKTYSFIGEIPTSYNLAGLLHTASRFTGFPGVRAMLYPKANKLRKLVRK